MKVRIWGSLGDEVALTGTVRELKKQFPDEIVRIENKFPEIFQNNPNINVGRIDSPYDITIPLSPDDYIGNYVRAYCKVLGIKCFDDSPELFLTDEESKMFPKQNTIAFDTWAGWPSRKWKFENFVKLIDLLHDYDKSIKVIEVGKTVPDCFGKTRTQRLPNVDGCFLDILNVRGTASLLSKCKLFIGNDAGLFHLAAAVKTPQIVIFSKSFYSRSYRKTYYVDNLQRNCKICDSECLKEVFCLDGISPKDVLEVYKVFKKEN
jgi:ADP-heptose:LPS heptosyltransferase